MKTPIKAAVAAVAAIALSLTACGGGGTSSDTQAPAANSSDLAKAGAQYNPQPRDNIKDGGTLTTSVPEITSQLNTFHGDGTLYSLQFWRWYNPTLINFAPDGTPSPNPDYLTSEKKEEKDGKTVVTYTINPKATYNDGSPIDWKSFESTWKTNNGKDEAYVASSTDGYSLIESVTKGVDDRQAVVTFSTVYAWPDGLFNVLLNPKAATPDVYNKGYINNAHAEWGAGPYTVDKLDTKNGTFSFKKNPKWWGEPGKLDTRTFKALESSADINAFKNGQLDAVAAETKDRLAQVNTVKDVDVRRSAAPSNRLLTLNAKSASGNLADVNVRKAVMLGIDRSVLAKISFNGLDYTEDPPGSFMLFGFQKGYEDNFTAAGYKYDAAEAGKLLDAAGWVPGADGVREKGGKKLSLEYPVIGDDATVIAGAKAVTSMLKAIGVTVVIDQHPSADFSKVFTSGQFDLFGLGFSSSDPFGFAYFCQIYCSDSGLNKSGTGTAALDKEAKALATVGDPTEQIAQGNKLEQKIFSETWGIMPTENGPQIVATKKGLANYGAGLFFVGKVEDIGWQK
ncbi:MAG: ABC transporter family substrate-binding protein [Propionibacteriaceae bacterium]